MQHLNNIKHYIKTKIKEQEKLLLLEDSGPIKTMYNIIIKENKEVLKIVDAEIWVKEKHDTTQG